MIATLDWSFSHGRDWGSPFIPETMNVQTMARFAPEALLRPRWLYAFVRSGRLPDLTTPNMAPEGQSGPHLLRRLRRVDADAAPELGGRGLDA